MPPAADKTVEVVCPPRSPTDPSQDSPSMLSFAALHRVPGCNGAVRLSLVLLWQILLVCAALAATVSFVYVTLSDQIEADVNNIVAVSLSRGVDTLRQPITTASRVLTTMRSDLTYRKLLISDLLPVYGTNVTGYLEMFTTYRRALTELPGLTAYISEDCERSTATGAGDMDPDSGVLYWDETDCLPGACYLQFSDEVNWVDIPNDNDTTNGVPLEVSSPSTFFSDRTVMLTTYISWIKDIPLEVRDTAWLPPSVWGEVNHDATVTLVASQCWSWSYVNASEPDPALRLESMRHPSPANLHCNNSLTLMLDFLAMARLAADVVSSPRSTSSITWVNTRQLLATTEPTVPQFYNSSAANEYLRVANSTVLNQFLWRDTQTPYVELNAAVAAFMGRCVSSTNTTLGLAGGVPVSRVTFSCTALIDVTATAVRGMQVVSLGDAVQLLYVQITPRDVYFASVDRALRVAIAITAALAGFAFVLLVGVFVSVTRSIRKLARNFEAAEAMDYEGVVEERIFFAELAALQVSFLRLNEKLIATRAFLPASLFGKSQGSEGGGVSCENLFDFDSAPADRAEAGERCEDDADGEGRRGAGTRDGAAAAAVAVAAPLRAPAAKRRPQVGSMWPRPRGLNLSSALATRRVTVVFVNVCNFHALCRARGPVVAQQALGFALEAVFGAVTEMRGVVDFFHGDHVMASFNASTNCTSQGLKCASAIIAVKQALLEGPPSVSTPPANPFAAGESKSPRSPPSSASAQPAALPANLPKLRVACGVSTGTVICGNFGTAQMRRFCVVGPVVNQAFALMQHTRNEGASVLVSPSAYDVMKDDVVLEHRNLVALTTGGGEAAASLISTIRRLRAGPLATSGTVAISGAGEQDALEEEEALLMELNRGFECAERLDLAEAQTILASIGEQLAAANRGDLKRAPLRAVMVKRLLGACDRLLGLVQQLSEQQEHPASVEYSPDVM